MEDVAVAGAEPVEALASIEGPGTNSVDLAAVREMLAAIDAAQEAHDRGVEVLPDALKKRERSARTAELRAPIDEARSRLAQYLRGHGFGEMSPVHVVWDSQVLRGRLGAHGINIDATPPMSVDNGRILFVVFPGLDAWPAAVEFPRAASGYLVELEQLRPGHPDGAADVDAVTGAADDQSPLDAGAIREELAGWRVEEETVFVPGDVPAQLRVVERSDGWHYGVYAILLEGSIDDVTEDGADQALPTREAALDAARERLVRWLSDQKERGAKRHRRQAEQLQERVLGMTFAPAEPIVVSIEPGPSASDPLDAVPRLVSLDLLDEAANNPRGDLVEIGLEQLATSMRETGFRPWLPIVARLLDDGRGIIAAGHRRSRAARLAGLTEVPCVLKRMTDEEFLDILNFDNGGREDVHPLYEASGWREWMEKTGKGVLDIAARIGMSKEYVYGRLKYDKLIPEAKAAFVAGKFTAEHAILIARRPENVQKAAVKYLEPNAYNGHVPSTRALADWLAGDQTADLEDAKFDRTDGMLLAGAGACKSCPKLQANDPGYELPLPTEDDAPDDLARRPQDCCLDPTCFRKKTDNHFIRIRTQLEQESGGPVVQVSSNWSAKGKGVLSKDKYEVVGSGGPVALVVDGYGAGRDDPGAGEGRAEEGEQGAGRSAEGEGSGSGEGAGGEAEARARDPQSDRRRGREGGGRDFGPAGSAGSAGGGAGRSGSGWRLDLRPAWDSDRWMAVGATHRQSAGEDEGPGGRDPGARAERRPRVLDVVARASGDSPARIGEAAQGRRGEDPVGDGEGGRAGGSGAGQEGGEEGGEEGVGEEGVGEEGRAGEEDAGCGCSDSDRCGAEEALGGASEAGRGGWREEMTPAQAQEVPV